MGIFHRKAHVVGLREAVLWGVFWVILALAFCLGIYCLWSAQTGGYTSSQAATAFLTGYVIEKSLSVGNLFVFAVLFTYFGVPPLYQHKVLCWGVLGALIMRAVFIFAGVALIEHFSWMIYLLGALLIATGTKMALAKGHEIHPDRNPVLRLMRKCVWVAQGGYPPRAPTDPYVRALAHRGRSGTLARRARLQPSWVGHVVLAGVSSGVSH